MADEKKECPWCKSKSLRKGASVCPRCNEYIEWKRPGKSFHVLALIIAIGLGVGTGGVALGVVIPLWIFCALSKSPKKAKE
jgi:hypothetical protein